SPRSESDALLHSLSSTKRLQDEDRTHNRTQYDVLAIRAAAILIATVVAVFVAPAKALAEIVVVIVSLDVVATIAIVGVAIGVGVFVVVAPVILPVRLSGAEALLITVVHRLP